MSLAKGTYAIFNTSEGKITIRLFEADAPVTVKNFLDLAEGKKEWTHPSTHAKSSNRLFDGTIFHRVIPNFMIQTGDPTGTGAHNCGFTIKDEIVPTLKFDQPGRLAMANIGQPNTGGCQFFITEAPNRGLDPPTGRYTIFGQVVDGQDLVGKIARVPRDADDKPRTAVRLISVTIKREGPEPAPTPAAPKKAAPPK
jgi:cyclophilin family peptidyl-prolyl cis-trans isomerase